LNGTTQRTSRRSTHAGFLPADEKHIKEKRAREQEAIISAQNHQRLMIEKRRQRFNERLQSALLPGLASGHTVVLFDKRTFWRSLYWQSTGTEAAASPDAPLAPLTPAEKLAASNAIMQQYIPDTGYESDEYFGSPAATAGRGAAASSTPEDEHPPVSAAPSRKYESR
jgi:hypothetical protein